MGFTRLVDLMSMSVRDPCFDTRAVDFGRRHGRSRLYNKERQVEPYCDEPLLCSRMPRASNLEGAHVPRAAH